MVSAYDAHTLPDVSQHTQIPISTTGAWLDSDYSDDYDSEEEEKAKKARAKQKKQKEQRERRALLEKHGLEVGAGGGRPLAPQARRRYVRIRV